MEVTIITEKYYQKNQLFNENDNISNRDDCLRPWIELKKALNVDKISLNTVDITPIFQADIVIFLNVPNENDPFYLESKSRNKIIFCIITELEFIHRNNSNLDLIYTFNKVFTYQDNLINNINIFKINYAFDFIKYSKEYQFIPFHKRLNFVNLIAGNKTLKHKDELYTKRVDIIKWFNKNHPDKFHLYGSGWNEKIVSKYFKIDYNKISFFKKIIPNYFKVYKGAIDSKKNTLINYKFSITLENAMNVPGWMTEKIFDSLFYGCIPIYLGASEINNYVDPKCYIDLRKFNSNEELYEFLINFSEQDYLKFQDNIHKFLLEKSLDPNFEFGISYFISTIKNQIIKYHKND